MPYILPQPVREHSAPYVFFENFLTKEECQKIIELSKILPPEAAKVGDGASGAVVPEKRRTEVFWINWEAQHNWLFEKMALAVANANSKWWGYHLAGFLEPLQLTRYKGEDKGFYDFHEDSGHTGSFLHRKLSAVILLSEDFEGGKFELFHEGQLKELKMGSMILFPSFKIHRVTEVTKGERWSLVSWISGPPFV